MSAIFRKNDPRPGRIAYEVAGLRWLAQAQGAPIVPVLNHGSDYLEEPRLTPTTPTAHAAETFGRALAHTHAAGATHLGAPPPETPHAWMGESPLTTIPHPPTHKQSWGAYYAEYRLLPHATHAPFTTSERHELDALLTKLHNGTYDHAQPHLVIHAGHNASRTHGDMWNGNLIWTPQGVTLIDPAAQGGHGEEDLAQLAVFGAPHLQRIWAAYNEHSPLENGWEERLPLHQLHMLMVHAQLFGHSYIPDIMRIVRRYA